MSIDTRSEQLPKLPLLPPETIIVPWRSDDLRGWSITSMHHAIIGHTKWLYVTMMRGDLCIRADGQDTDLRIWDSLKRLARHKDGKL